MQVSDQKTNSEAGVAAMVTDLFNGLLDSNLIVDSHHRQYRGVGPYGGLQ